MEIVTGERSLSLAPKPPPPGVACKTSESSSGQAPHEPDTATRDPNLAQTLRLSWAAATDIGLRRTDNQDSFLAVPPFFLVADGMGGHAGGKQASHTLLAALEPFRGRALSEEKLRRLLATACREVMSLADANLDYSISPPGTTLTGLALVNAVLLPVHEAPSGGVGEDFQTRSVRETGKLPVGVPGLAGISENVRQTGEAPHETVSPAPSEPASATPGFLVLNVGDSRTYVLENGYLQQLTRDHSQVAQMLEAGLITREMARFMPNRSVITRAVGAGQTVLPEIDTWRRPLVGNSGPQRFLVCSDGLHSMVHEGLIGETLADADTPEEAVKSLVQAALNAGGLDNVTVLVVDVNPGDAGEAMAARTDATRVSIAKTDTQNEGSRDVGVASASGQASHEPGEPKGRRE